MIKPIPYGRLKGRLITENGQILKKNESGFLSQKEKASGLLSVSSRDEGVKIEEYVHILVARTFITNENNCKYVKHLDGNVKNNNRNNLAWVESLEDLSYYTPIPGFPKYGISKESIIKSFVYKNSCKTIKKQRDEGGYMIVRIVDYTGKKRNMRVCRLMAVTYIPNWENLPEVDHVDRNRSNDNLNNLRWADRIMQCANKAQRRKSIKKINQYTLENIFIKTYPNMDSILDELDLPECSRQAIRQSIRKNRNGRLNNSSYGFKWALVEEKYVLEKGEEALPIVGTYNKKTLDFPKHKITNYGNVIGIQGYRMPLANSSVCPTVTLQHNGVKITFQVHVLVATFFVSGKTNKKNQVNHLDEDRTNSRYNNLEWVTPSRNVKFSRHKTYKAVNKIDAETGEIIKSYESITIASMDVKGDVSAKSGISNCCKGKTKTSYGFVWQYIN